MPQETAKTPIPNVTRIAMTFFAAEEDRFPGNDAPQAFWDYIRKHIHNGGVDNENIRELEQRLVQRFGRYLRDLLVTDFRMGSESRRDRRRPFPVEFYVERREAVPSPVFAFQVAGFRYGSLSLDIDVAGLKGLADFFDQNTDLLRIVLCQYAPAALAMAVTGNGDGWIDGLECRLQSAPELELAFTNSLPSPPAGTPVGTQTPAANPSRKMESLNWAWVISNTSLVLPVLLSLVVIYFAFVSLEHERDRLSQGMASLADKQTEIMKVLVTITQQQRPGTDIVSKPTVATKQ